MSRPRYRWWGYVKNVIRAWPELERLAAAPPHVSVTAKPGPVTAAHGVGRPVERAAVHRMTAQDEREHRALRAAIRETAALPNGDARLAIIDLVYWKRVNTLRGAAKAVGYSYRWARELHREFICLVAEKLDLKEKNGPQSQKDAL